MIDREELFRHPGTSAPRLGLATTAAAVALLGGARAARAEMRPEPPPASPLNYVTAVVGTTLVYRPNGGSFEGAQKDINPAIGYGRLITPTIALELDAGLVLNSDGYQSTYLIPGVVWNFSTHVYAAMRFVVPVDPEVNLGLFPGIGLVQAFSNGISVSLELNPSSTIGRGKPDFGLPLTAGVVYSF